MSADKPIVPRTFYLNEQHEFSRTERESGGRVTQYADIDWTAKGHSLSGSLNSVSAQIQASHDPLKESRYFVLAAPEKKLAKVSTDKSKATDGKVYEQTHFSEKHSRVFKRLGMDLVGVLESGSAVVHFKPETFDRLVNSAQSLSNLGPRDKSRWAPISKFEMVPIEAKIDLTWLEGMKAGAAVDGVIELQPLLTRAEVESMFRAIVQMFQKSADEKPVGSGTDFSGRHWLKGKVTPRTLRRLAEDFFSIQSLHSPLMSVVAQAQKSSNKDSGVPKLPPAQIELLPTIGVLDTGVFADHVILSKYRRGAYVSPLSSATPLDPHGTFVSSRVVFGDRDYNEGLPDRTPNGEVRFYDINVGGLNPEEIEGKVVVNPALQTIVSTAPDVRVFNMSFDSQPLGDLFPVEKAERLLLVQDLDNFIFQNDVLVVVAAGNSPKGVVPMEAYPQNFSDPQWELGPWARSFNSLTCGSYIGHLTPGGIQAEIGWPSPFCRVGPGLCDSPKPDFSANGGNVSQLYQWAPGLGVWGLSASGLWEDKSGTSHAAPLLARECAFAIQHLQKVCEQGAQPFAVTVKAFLALTAEPAEVRGSARELATKTLGRGRASARRLGVPIHSSGVMLWQGVLADDKDIARVMLPIPPDWVKNAAEPRLRLIVAWDPPVNAAVRDVWSTRSISPKLRRHASAPAQHPNRGEGTGTYPLVERKYDLKKRPSKSADEDDDDVWIVELGYEQIADYHPAMVFPPQQRVAFAAELLDEGPSQLSPQSFLQALPVTQTMTRLSVPPVANRVPVILRTPV
jgi:hypothetical protein